MSTGIKNPRTRSVHAPNSDADRRSQLATVLHLMNTGQGAFAKMSWRDIADFYERYYQAEFSHSTLRRYAWPVCDPVVNPEHCAAFDLTPLVPTPACPSCGGACTFDCGTQQPHAKSGTHPTRNRRAINMADPQSAYRTIVKHLGDGADAYLAKFVRIVLDEGLELDY